MAPGAVLFLFGYHGVAHEDIPVFDQVPGAGSHREYGGDMETDMPEIIEGGHHDIGDRQGVLARGEHAEALTLAKLAINNLQRKLGAGHVLSADALVTLGRAQLAAGSAAPALATLQAAVASTRKAYREGHPSIADALIAEAQAL